MAPEGAEYMTRVSVVMTTYNNAEFLLSAIHSILHQTFTDFEFLIVDDASFDATPEILARIADPRVTVLTNETNIGIPASAQRALARARGDFVARMDSDDVSVKNRLERQVEFLDADVNAEIGVVGGQRLLLDVHGNQYDSPIQVKLTHNLIVWSVFLGASFWHSSTMIRRSVLERVSGYNPAYRYASDLELWTRLMFECRFANINEPLIGYRIHDRNTSQLWRLFPAPPPPRTNLASRVSGVEVPPGRFNMITKILYSDGRVSREQACELSAFLIRLYSGLLDADVLTAERRDIVTELASNVSRLHEQAPESLAIAARDVVESVVAASALCLSNRRGDSRPETMRRFIHDRSTGNRPLL